jgi:DNA replication protein DnaC
MDHKMTARTTIETLRSLRLSGMAEGFEQQISQTSFSSLSFEQRFQMTVLSEISHRESQRYKRVLKNAKLKVIAMPEDINYSTDRDLDRAAVASLMTCTWIHKAQNILITGATGTGKTFLACAFGVEAARHGITVSYRRVNRLLEEMNIAHKDGSISKLRSQLSKTDLLILDDFGLAPIIAQGRSDLLEILDDRIGSSSTIILGQMPINGWHDYINDPAMADAILDRLIHNSHIFPLKGESIRKKQSKSK